MENANVDFHPTPLNGDGMHIGDRFDFNDDLVWRGNNDENN
jgi:hypothetical protein